MKILKANIIPLLIIIFFFTVFSLISLVNHCLFRTSALDLGMFNHALYQCANFRKIVFTLDISGTPANYFASHFSPVIYLYIPLYYLFGSYTLLIVQILAVICGGVAVLKISRERCQGNFIPLMVMIHFFSIWAVYSALAFDYHDNVVASMLVPWFVYFYFRGDRVNQIIFLALIILCRENMSLWMIFIISGLILWQWKENKASFRKQLPFSILLIVVSAIYFILVIEIIMPALSQDSIATQVSRYTAFGDSIREITVNLLSHPGKVLSLMFRSSIEGEIFKGIKTETHLMVILSGGFAILLYPRFLIMLIPIYLQKFLSDDYALWGINAHYSIEFVPVISFAFITLISRTRKEKYRYIAGLLIIMMTFTATVSKIEKRRSLWYDPVNTRFYSREHYESQLNHKMIYEEIKRGCGFCKHLPCSTSCRTGQDLYVPGSQGC